MQSIVQIALGFIKYVQGGCQWALIIDKNKYVLKSLINRKHSSAKYHPLLIIWIILERSDIEQPTESKQARPDVALAIQDFAEFSQASSPMLGMHRNGDYCSSPPLTRSSSRESDDRPKYEDISPPASPSHEDKPHIIIEAPCSPLHMFHPKRRNSLSDGSSCTSSPSTSPSCFRGACLKIPSEQNYSSRPYRSLSATRDSRSLSVMRDSVNGRVSALLCSLIKKGKWI
jgi:hypothetical protein